jgi:hypothetical protein
VKENGIFFRFEYLIFIFIIKYSTSGVANIADHGTIGPRKFLMLAERKKGGKKKGERKKRRKRKEKE